ncbi:solute carrier organic anion transporter family member 6A1 isoform X3 [Peromyscus maniculatus bairdii]|uniref:solute carrier organic anion transporter family member 6A1 isoform X3 n=1 Tax=Peromyscus maniculatus bairdii TaxID=230844 RepID=UPI001C2E3E17|nr:solute carrier organic anion transporter family member 6A1 isoform X3 [Peromyscus maniculatus bairdii]
MDQGLERAEGSMEEVEEENDGDNQQQPVGLGKLSPFLTTIPTAMIKFSSLRKSKMPVSSDTKKLPDTKQSDFLEGPFGLGSLVFPSLQRFNNINFFLSMYCTVVLAQGFIFGFIDLSIGHFEKEFYLSRPEKVILSSTYDFASLLVAIPVAYYGDKWHKPKWVAVGAFLVGLGSISCAVPYMKYEIVATLEEGRELCIEREHRTRVECKETMVPHRSEILGLVIFGQCLQGFAAIPIYVLGVTYIYEHSAKYSAGIYLGIGELVQVLGYGLGYTTGSPNLKPTSTEDSTEGRAHNFLQRQVIWWAGFLFATSLSWISFIPLLCFPTHLPGARKLKLRREKGPLTFDKKLRYKKFGPRLKDLFHALQTYYNCSCIKEGLTNADTQGDFVDAVSGKCNTRCFKLPLFFAFFFSSIVFSTSAAIPITLVILQTVPPNLKSLSMGVTYTTLRLFGSIPGPLIFRLSASNSCIYWDINKCGDRGRCWIYNKSKMAYILLGLCTACKLATTFLVLSALLKYDVIVAENAEDMDLPENKTKETKKRKNYF